MAGVRQIKIIGLTLLVICLVFILHRTGSNAASLVHAQASDQLPHKQATNAGGSAPPSKPNNLVEDFAGSNNDDKVDEAINREISKDRENDLPAKPQNGGPSSNEQSEVSEEFDPAAELIKIRALSPMTIFSKSYCPFSKALKALMSTTYTITPEPNIVELDKHEHGAQLQDYLAEKSGRRTVPNVLVGTSFESRGGNDDFQAFHQEGELIKKLKEWGAGRLEVIKNDTPSNA
ncbi:uncharacterized protein SPAPADRAFT_61163 [Spathaspora passalidarum NRRL Y-27907]|uniref:Glutaredoxin domain-containing protein n=1 Tax=Spathaspora passalidarum (strain NRRL Y-27907 / 11-Y1) TaxID=619300 RepID=G3AP48_SPAPN|nr:uncharacterized protein SPAPADRAFT_61163 [Spathaspora passalidarum NRRL Y-27907]EGW32079.1 hypothetical protein SPAPADRAFT_61163 [Spathaspora passalidarum NRRL Y-27907]